MSYALGLRLLYLYVSLNLGKSSWPEGTGTSVCYMHMLKSFSVLPPTGPLMTFGCSAIRRTLRRTLVETALFLRKWQRLLLFERRLKLPRLRLHFTDITPWRVLQAAFEKSHASHPRAYPLRIQLPGHSH